EGVHVVDALLPSLGRDLRFVRPAVELHLRDAGDLTDLAQIELDLVEVLREVDRLEQVYMSRHRHGASLLRLDAGPLELRVIRPPVAFWKGSVFPSPRCAFRLGEVRASHALD